MKRVFISQPMRNKSDKEILEERERIYLLVRSKINEPIEVIDSFFEGAPVDAKPLWYLGESFKKLSEADIAYFANGWEYARGCKLEHQAAIEYGIDTLLYD